IDQRVRKILHAKYWAGLNNYKPVSLTNLQQDVDRPLSNVVQEQLYEHAVTVARNKGNLIPFRNLDTLSIASVAIGTGPNSIFQQTLGNYAPVTKFSIKDRFAPDTTFTKLISKLQDHDVVVVSVHGMN